jgi:YVTN family beta-propeller protein
MGDDSISVVDLKSTKEKSRVHLIPFTDKYGKPGSLVRKPMMGPHSIKIDKSGKNLYCANCFDDSISVIDVEKLEVKETFTAGSHPNDMVFNTDETFMNVTNGDSNSVSVIDMSCKRIITQVSIGVMPHGICISPDGEFVYAANMDSSSISIIDTWSNSKVACLKVGKCPVEVSLSQDGRFLFVVCSQLGSERNGVISILSTSSYRLIKNIDVGLIPIQMLQTKDGKYAYVTNMGSNNLCVIDLSRFEVVKKINLWGGMPRGIVMNEEGTVFITNNEDNNVSVIKSESWELLCNIGVGKEPTSMSYMKRISR